MDHGKPHRNHIFQLCAYALLLEDYFKQPVTKGFVYLIPLSDAVVFHLSLDLKDQTRTMLSEIRRMIEKEEMPPADDSKKPMHGLRVQEFLWRCLLK